MNAIIVVLEFDMSTSTTETIPLTIASSYGLLIHIGNASATKCRLVVGSHLHSHLHSHCMQQPMGLCTMKVRQNQGRR